MGALEEWLSAGLKGRNEGRLRGEENVGTQRTGGVRGEGMLG